MNRMQTIYDQQADLYDELVNHEDVDNNLVQLLTKEIDFSNTSVCEYGVGTGRLTKYYIALVEKADLFDNSIHMLKKVKSNLIDFIDKVSINELDNRKIDTITTYYDISIEGWSFGHLISDKQDFAEYWSTKLISDLKKISRKIIIIETLGTNIEEPKAPNKSLELFYNKLKEEGFKEYIIRTDYMFETTNKAQSILGAFFGKEMEENIRINNKTRIKEFTGVWIF